MSEKKKKLFPKLKKKLEDFLTDESGEITKKDALGVAAGAAILASVESVDAGHSSSNYHNWNPALPTDGSSLTIISNTTCAHVSGVVNGHLSQTPSVSASANVYNHTSGHNSHSSHGSGGWC